MIYIGWHLCLCSQTAKIQLYSIMWISNFIYSKLCFGCKARVPSRVIRADKLTWSYYVDIFYHQLHGSLTLQFFTCLHCPSPLQIHSSLTLIPSSFLSAPTPCDITRSSHFSPHPTSPPLSFSCFPSSSFLLHLFMCRGQSRPHGEHTAIKMLLFFNEFISVS